MAKPNRESSPVLIVLMPIAIGPAVASNCYAQPLFDTITHNFSLPASSTGFTVIATQLGYAAGLLSFVSLSGMFERRHLIVLVVLLAAGGMLITASSQSLVIMILGTVLASLFSVVAQILVPLAAALTSPNKRGKAVGTIMGGLLLEILLVRIVAGLLANLDGWHTVFWVASMLMALMVLALWRGLPQMKSETHLDYPQLSGSVFSMFISGKILRTRMLLGCLIFTNLNTLWTSVVFLFVAPPLSYSDGVIGPLGLAGAAGMLDVRPAGGLTDEGKSYHTTAFGLLLLLLSWLTIWFGHTSVLVLIIGILVLDLAVQDVHTTNQTIIYWIHPDTRNRPTAGYMTSYFIGGAAGSLVSASAWQHGDWVGMCSAGATVTLVSLLAWWRGFYCQEAAN